jgi:hypothetical protein
VKIYPLLSYFASKIPYCGEDWGQDVFDGQKYGFRYLKKDAHLVQRSQGYGDISEQDQTMMEITFFFSPPLTRVYIKAGAFYANILDKFIFQGIYAG